MKLSVLLSAISEEILEIGNGICDNGKDVEVKGLSVDSRTVKSGDLFICLSGGKTDSHEFAIEAVEKGTVAIIAEKATGCAVEIIVSDTRKALSRLSARFFGDPSKNMQIVGVTGTNGKTTTSHMLANIMRFAGKKVGVIGTLGVFYDGKEFPCELTTPDPIPLQKTLSEMLEKGIEYVVMEVSAHALYYYKTEGIYFSACIFTNLTQDHLDFFSSMEEYKKAKLRLFEESRCSVAIVNTDDAVGKEIYRNRLAENKNLKTVSYGLDSPSDSFAVVTNESLNGCGFLLNVNDELAKISLKTCGRYNVLNALAAATCAIHLGFSMEEVALGLNGIGVIKGRLERIARHQGGTVFVDFAHTPDGLEKSLKSLKKYCKGRLICVFGCGGNRDSSKRSLMGKCASSIADFCVITSDNPRYENPEKIIEEIEKGFIGGSSAYVSITNRKAAIVYALGCLTDGDVLLVAGKGAEDYQEIAGIKYPYNDKNFILKIIGRD